MRILEKRRDTSVSGVSLGLVRTARFSKELVVSKVAVGRRQRATWCLLRRARMLRSASGVTIPSVTVKCTVFLRCFGMLSILGVGFRAVIEVEDAFFRVCTLRIFVLSVNNAFVVGLFAITVFIRKCVANSANRRRFARHGVVAPTR